MKTIFAVLILLALIPCSPLVFGQDEDHGGKGWRHKQEERLANLSADERQKVISAHQTAMRDPAVQAARQKMKQARKDYRASLHAAMLKADPSLQPLLDKIPKREKSED